MEKKLLFALSLLSISFASAQTFQKTYGSGSEYGRWVEQTNDNGFIVAASTSSIGAGGNDAYLMRLDNAGDTLWTRSYGGAGWEEIFSVNQNTDNGFIVAGFTASFGALGSDDAYVVRTDANGDTLWTKVYGGTSGDWAWSVDQTSDGGFIIAGQTSSFGSGSWDVYAVRTDENGDTLWTRTYGGINEDIAYSVEETNDSGFIFCGITRSFTSGATGIYVIKTDANGDTLWTRSINGSTYNNGQTIQQTSDSGYIISAISTAGTGGSGDICLIKIDNAGIVQWSKAFGRVGDDYAFNAEQASDGGYFICGSLNLAVSGPAIAYLMRTDAFGDTLWTRTFDAIQTTNAGSGAVTNDGGFIMATHHSVAGNVYVIKVDSAGNTYCNPQFTTVTASSPLMDAITTATLTDRPNTLVNNTGTMSSTGGPVNDLCSTVGIEEEKNELFSVYPNPFSTQTTLQTDNPFHNATLTVDNCFGQTVTQIKNINGQTITFSRDNLPSGLYFFRLTTADNKIYTDKFVITDK